MPCEHKHGRLMWPSIRGIDTGDVAEFFNIIHGQLKSYLLVLLCLLMLSNDSNHRCSMTKFGNLALVICTISPTVYIH